MEITKTAEEGVSKADMAQTTTQAYIRHTPPIRLFGVTLCLSKNYPAAIQLISFCTVSKS